MTLPQWAKQDSFWSRHYELAEMTEDAISDALEAQCEQWLAELEESE